MLLLKELLQTMMTASSPVKIKTAYFKEWMTAILSVKNSLVCINPERMDGCICSVKKSHYMKEWMAQADPLKEASRVKKINGRLLPISSNE